MRIRVFNAAPAAVGLLFPVEAAVGPGTVSARTARFAFPLLLVGEEGEGEILALFSRLFVVLILFAFHVGNLEENILKRKSVARKKRDWWGVPSPCLQLRFN
jgi:hypothetical protein